MKIKNLCQQHTCVCLILQWGDLAVSLEGLKMSANFSTPNYCWVRVVAKIPNTLESNTFHSEII